MKIISFCILYLLITSQMLSAADSSIGYFFQGPIGLGGNTNDPIVQSKNSAYSGQKAELTYFNGETSGFLFGVGYASEHREYYFPKTRTEVHSYNFDNEYVFIKAGYWHTLKDKLRLMGFADVGYGGYEFSDVNQHNVAKDKIITIDAGARATYGIDLNKLHFDLTGGAGITKPFVPSFNYNGDRFDSNVFTPSPYFLIGIAFRF